MKTGTVKFFNEDKGYGFITQDDGAGDLFVHATELTNGRIKQDDRVQFEVAEGKKGLNAKKVAKV